MRSFKYKSNGSATKLIWSRDKILICHFLQIVRSLELKSQSLNRKNWDLTIRFKDMRKKSDSLRLPRRILISKWTSWMISFTRILISKRNWRMITSTLKMNSSKSWRNWKTRASGLRTISPTSRSRKPMSWLKLWKLRDKFYFGRERFSLRKKCKTRLTQQLARLRLWQWRKRFTEWSWDTSNCERSRKRWSRTWKDQSSRERPSSWSIFQRLKRRMLKISLLKASYQDRSQTWSRLWSTQLRTPCSLNRQSSKDIGSKKTSTGRFSSTETYSIRNSRYTSRTPTKFWLRRWRNADHSIRQFHSRRSKRLTTTSQAIDSEANSSLRIRQETPWSRPEAKTWWLKRCLTESRTRTQISMSFWASALDGETNTSVRLFDNAWKVHWSKLFAIFLFNFIITLGFYDYI